MEYWIILICLSSITPACTYLNISNDGVLEKFIWICVWTQLGVTCHPNMAQSLYYLSAFRMRYLKLIQLYTMPAPYMTRIPHLLVPIMLVSISYLVYIPWIWLSMLNVLLASHASYCSENRRTGNQTTFGTPTLINIYCPWKLFGGSSHVLLSRVTKLAKAQELFKRHVRRTHTC